METLASFTTTTTTTTCFLHFCSSACSLLYFITSYFILFMSLCNFIFFHFPLLIYLTVLEWNVICWLRLTQLLWNYEWLYHKRFYNVALCCVPERRLHWAVHNGADRKHNSVWGKPGARCNHYTVCCSCGWALYLYLSLFTSDQLLELLVCTAGIAQMSKGKVDGWMDGWMEMDGRIDGWIEWLNIMNPSV